VEVSIINIDAVIVELGRREKSVFVPPYFVSGAQFIFRNGDDAEISALTLSFLTFLAHKIICMILMYLY
jgi:ABC-type amino acid transport substrate-binding protein